MIFRGRAPEATVWQRFRSSVEGFTFARREDGVYEANVSANAERAVDLFYTLTEQLPPAVDVVLDDRRATKVWTGEDIALPDIRDAIARMKFPLGTYGGIEISLYSPDDQLTLTPRLELYAYARSDRWLYLLQGYGLEDYSSSALADGSSSALAHGSSSVLAHSSLHAPAQGGRRAQPWNRQPSPVLSDAIEAAARRLALRPV